MSTQNRPVETPLTVCDICDEAIMEKDSEKVALRFGTYQPIQKNPRPKWLTFFRPWYDDPGQRRETIQWDFHTQCFIDTMTPHIHSDAAGS